MNFKRSKRIKLDESLNGSVFILGDRPLSFELTNVQPNARTEKRNKNGCEFAHKRFALHYNWKAQKPKAIETINEKIKYLWISPFYNRIGYFEKSFLNRKTSNRLFFGSRIPFPTSSSFDRPMSDSRIVKYRSFTKTVLVLNFYIVKFDKPTVHSYSFGTSIATP